MHYYSIFNLPMKWARFTVRTRKSSKVSLFLKNSIRQMYFGNFLLQRMQHTRFCSSASS
jgi:hypothetical protein